MLQLSVPLITFRRSLSAHISCLAPGLNVTRELEHKPPVYHIDLLYVISQRTHVMFCYCYRIR